MAFQILCDDEPVYTVTDDGSIYSMPRYVPEQLPSGQWRIRDTRDHELRIQAVRFQSEAIRRAEHLNRDFLDTDWNA